MLPSCALCGDRKLTIPKGNIYWRARLGCESEEITDDNGGLRVIHDEDRPYSKDKMKPISNRQSEGRANPRGIPYLYRVAGKFRPTDEKRRAIRRPVGEDAA